MGSFDFVWSESLMQFPHFSNSLEHVRVDMHIIGFLKINYVRLDIAHRTRIYLHFELRCESRILLKLKRSPNDNINMGFRCNRCLQQSYKINDIVLNWCRKQRMHSGLTRRSSGNRDWNKELWEDGDLPRQYVSEWLYSLQRMRLTSLRTCI